MKTRTLLSLLFSSLGLGSCQLILDKFGPDKCNGVVKECQDDSILLTCEEDFLKKTKCEEGCLIEFNECNLCGDEKVDDATEEECDDGGLSAGDGCDEGCAVEPGFVCDGDPSVCTLACGNGVVEAALGETCDDGNADNSDACPDGAGGSCRTSLCGDGFVQGGVEECDDGGLLPNDGCDGDCFLEFCGDGLLNNTDEVCDDGKQCSDGAPCLDDGECAAAQNDQLCQPRAGDGCRADCALELCGDNFLDVNEACDDGNVIAGDDCRADCKGLEVCGDGQLDTISGEACDDGNTLSNDGCSSSCAFEVCGDGVLQAGIGEVCDDSNTTAGDDCRADCKGLEVCGDGQIDTIKGEACDDGNLTGGDGCSGACLSETCGNGVLDANEECEENNTANGDGCDTNCLSTCTNLGGQTDPANGHCYILRSQLRNWEQARVDCLSINSNANGNPVGHLTTITSAEENLFVRGLNLNLALWIGLNDLTTEGQVRWLNGERLSYFINFAGGQPDNSGDCMQFFAGNISWDDTDCASNAPYVCEVDFGRQCGDGLVEDGEVCDDGNTNNGDGCNASCTAFSCADEAAGSTGNRTLAFSDSCYVLFSGAGRERSWQSADTDCRSRGGHLATIRNGIGGGTEHEIIKQLEDLINTGIWIGINDLEIEGLFQWSTGEPVTFTRFDSGEPNNAGGVEDCIELDNDTEWNDNNCANQNSYLCEF